MHTSAHTMGISHSYRGKKGRIKAYFNANWVWNNASFMFLCTQSHCDDKECYQNVRKSHTEERPAIKQAFKICSCTKHEEHPHIILRARISWNEEPPTPSYFYCPLSDEWPVCKLSFFHAARLRYVFILWQWHSESNLKMKEKRKTEIKASKGLKIMQWESIGPWKSCLL